MQVMFSNPLIYVIDYPAYGAIELFDRRSGKVGLMLGSDADKFRHEFDDLMTGDPGPDAFQSFMEEYSDVVMQPVIRH